MKFLIFGFALCISSSVISANYLKEKPAFLGSCSMKSANFKSCYGKEFESVFHEWKNGVPGNKGIGKLDPIHVKRVKISQASSGSISLHADLTNVLIKGTSKVIVSEAVLTKDITAKIQAKIPKLRFESDYKLEGRISAIPLNGQGKMHFEADNVELFIVVSNKLRDQDGHVFCDVQDVKTQIKGISNFHMQMDNLFGGQRALEESTNNLLNQNWRDYFEVMREPIEETVRTVLLDRLRKIFKYVPSSYFVEDLPTAAAYNG